MAMNLLQQLAASQLPVTLTSPLEVDQIRILRAAGLVIALTPAPTDPLALSGGGPMAQVLAVTKKGLEELGKFSYPAAQSPPGRPPLGQLTAKLFGAVDRRNEQ